MMANLMTGANSAASAREGEAQDRHAGKNIQARLS
jgi:hypothetical protein